eukprot:TRINITY_DN15419_c0_g1_i2.p1 TRINITY_DN15419_c0_g1~~TRINITY_DN15419_c0_g1_i2.p1  ORF type:complete len:405 (-),score=113.91 TRINITY_DN15419_c0_g1_i2:192-1406(-)
MAPAFRSLALAGALAGEVAAADAKGELFFAASAGCDGQDPTPCTGKPDKLLWSYTLAENGEILLNEQIKIDSEAPAWLTTMEAQDGQPKCLFVSLADKSKMLPFKFNGNKLEQIGDGVDSNGINPVHASVTSDGKTLVVANYHGPDDVCDSTGSSVASFKIGDDCSLTPADNKPHAGSSKIKNRQCASHIHSVTPGPDNLVFACDLGADLIFTYKVAADGKLTEVAKVATEPGTGPRHIAVHPTKRSLYVVSEMGSLVTSYNIEESGALKKVSEHSSEMPKELELGYGSKAAEIIISKDGSTLYVSNRAFDAKFRNTIAVFHINEDGTLSMQEQVDAPNFPRGMVLSKDEKHLVVASQHTGILESYQVLEGGLEYTGYAAAGPPTCAALSSPTKSMGMNGVVQV